jgi:hypothetical protein
MTQQGALSLRGPGPGSKWHASPTKVYKGEFGAIRLLVPEFERRSFGLRQPCNPYSRLNERLDMIVRKPFGGDQDFVPVGIVSKEYVLVPHSAVFDTVRKALKGVGKDPDSAKTKLVISEYGERMELSVYLPEEYSFEPGDGYPLVLRLECFNSVDGSSRFLAFMG